MSEQTATPSSHWRAEGQADPHAGHYDCERAALAMGNLTDDELANAAFVNYDVRPPLQDIIAGKAYSPIAYMTAVKDRIRWLSRSLEKAISERDALAAELKAVREQEPVAWFCYSSEAGYCNFGTLQEASSCAAEWLEECRRDAVQDGEWPEDADTIVFGAVLGRTTELKGNSDGEEWVEYQLTHPSPSRKLNGEDE